MGGGIGRSAEVVVVRLCRFFTINGGRRIGAASIRMQFEECFLKAHTQSTRCAHGAGPKYVPIAPTVHP